VKRAIAVHRIDFAAIVVLVLLAILVSGYILEHQPAFSFDQSYYTVKAPFSTGAAVTAGQGQAITIAGVQVGQVGGVSLEDGQAVVTMNIYKKYAPIYRNATVLLRPRTPLKDMYLALDPGSKGSGTVPNGGSLTAAQTNPDVDVSQILSSLDADTRNYLVLLLASGAQAFHDHGSTQEAPSPKAVADLRGTFKRFEPLDRDTLSLTHLIAARDNNLRRSIHNLNLVANSLGDVVGHELLGDRGQRHAARADPVAVPGHAAPDPANGRQGQDVLAGEHHDAARAGPVRAQSRPRARRVAAAVPRHDAGDQEPAAAVLGRRPATREDAGVLVGLAVEDDPEAVEVDRRPQ
jgi:phospholipid/cholesterol/gamma-HCH transport system substrate-binding protein